MARSDCPDDPRVGDDSTVHLVRTLADAGYDDVLVLDLADARSILTGRRIELLDTIATEEPQAVGDLADTLDRDVAAISRDLDVCFEYDLIEYERDGKRKRPSLRHETVLVEPIVHSRS